MGTEEKEDHRSHERVIVEMLEKVKQERDDLKMKYSVELRRNTALSLDFEAMKNDMAKLERVVRAAEAVYEWVGVRPPDTIMLGAVRQKAKELAESLAAVTWRL